jgi:hypothetical protein
MEFINVEQYDTREKFSSDPPGGFAANVPLFAHKEF